jgi:outer membrane exchange protein TraA
MRRILAAAGLICALSPASAGAAPVSIQGPIAPPLNGDGTGLCAATAVSMTPAADFVNLTESTYTSGMNAFFETHKPDRIEAVLRTVFDLSNNNEGGFKQSQGDFIDAMMPECKSGGCDFAYTDPSTSFGVRLRGFFNVTADLAGQPIHFGFYVDDAVSLTFWNKNQEQLPVIIHPPDVFASTHRITEMVTFDEPGVYPLEILYVEGYDHAALEMSFYVGAFTDVSGPVSQTSSLKDAGFTLFPPTSFFQALSGPSFPDLNQCQQCDRQFINQAGNNGCVPGHYCNEAALCAPCDTAIFCGPTCAPCGGDTPFCVNNNGQNECASCRDDSDCQAGFECDPLSHTCNACEDCGGASSSSMNNAEDAGGGCGMSCAVSRSAPGGGLALLAAGAALAHFRRRRRALAGHEAPRLDA